jgi:serine/threonine protein kinase
MAKLTDPSARLRCFDQILSGAEAAHLSGVVHRDIKPENILCDANVTSFVVADFGIAHFGDEELYTAAETRDDARLANFLYAAPEQRERGKPVTDRSDIYALGLLLNELFTGSVPHGTAYKTIADSSSDYAWLDSVIEAMIRQRPEQRLSSIGAIKLALIRHKQDFVMRQRLDEIERTVIPTTEVTDPLAKQPPQILDFGWSRGKLTLILDRPVHNEWVVALQNMGDYTAVYGKHPEAFSFQGKAATVAAGEHEIQDIINYFKAWLPKATAVYARTIEREQRKAEDLQRAQLLAEQAEIEQNRRIRATIKI